MCSVLYISCLCLLQLVICSGATPTPRVNCENDHNQSKLNSFLWTLKRNPPSYFFGTIHVPYTQVWNFIPQSTKTAFDEAEEIIFELDLTNPYTISALADCQLLPKGEKLDKILPPDIYQRLKRHIQYVKSMLPVWMTADQKGKGLYADYLFNAVAGNWERKRPVWVMLMVNSLTENDIKSRGVPVLDLYLAQEAERIGKITSAVERVEEQCVPLNELNFSQVLFALNQTLWQHEVSRSVNNTMRYTTEDLIQHYNCGDLNAIIFNHDTAQVPNLVNNSLPPQELETAKLIDDYFREQLINKRNKRMTERVINLLKAYPEKSFFFAFGAGHFLGNDTIVDRLNRAGYEVEHTSPDAHIPVTDKSKRKKYRRRKIHQDYQGGNFWFQMDGDSRTWNDERKTRKQRKNERRTKPFNDLWIKMDSYDANLMAELAEKYGYPERRRNKTKPAKMYYNGEYHSTSCRIDCNLLTFIFILLLKVLLWS